MSEQASEEQDAVLPAPARVRLLQVASEVLGRLSAEEIPPSLRAIARFTPSKRHRAGGAVISAALDAEADFRAKVADVVAETAPQLVEALTSGASTAASDPIDTAVVAYLIRPPGWQAAILEATARWSEGRRESDTGERDRLRAEIAELRSQARAEPARLRAEVDAALVAQAEELDQARRALRVRVGELRAAERERDQARAAAQLVAEQATEQARAAAATLASELERARARIAELERAAESARRVARIERELDDARLRLLLDTVVEGAAGLRRELDLPVAAVRPADAVESGVAGAGAKSVADGVELERVLALPQAHLIVDGYNVTKTGYGELSLADQRTRLVTSLAALQARTGIEATVAFDGGIKPPAQPRVPRGLRVLFSAPDELADDLIRRLVAAEPAGRAVIVVTSDRAVATDVRRAGAWTVASAVLLERLA